MGSNRLCKGVCSSVAICILLILACLSVTADESPPFFPGGTYDESVPSPKDVLGFEPGDRPVPYHDMYRYFRTLADASPYLTFVNAGRTYENREMFYLIAGSEENLARLDEIKRNNALLADPRKTTAEEAQTLADSNPAVMWLMYSIHGNETSGADASLQVAYQLAAGTDDVTRHIRDELIIGLWPLQNPDGRERFLSHIHQWNGTVKNGDIQSMQHLGMWPYGRTNHYLFDLNRDWFILAHPETRARVTALAPWHPQVVVDIHEMGSYDTYLFNPPREPINRHINQAVKKWWRVFSKDQASAFDDYGWSYYTREWLENWYPGYTTSWADCSGAVGILFEQAYTGGTQTDRPEGRSMTFREAVHHQFTGSLATLKTAATNRVALLNDFHAMRVESLENLKKSPVKAFVIDPGENTGRTERCIERLLMQGIEIDRVSESFTVKAAYGIASTVAEKKVFRSGAYLISLEQPLRPLIEAVLEFDPRLSTPFLELEREHLVKGKGTRMYEVSTWSMAVAYGLEAWTLDECPDVAVERVTSVSGEAGSVTDENPRYGWLIDYADDDAVRILMRLFERDVRVRAAKKPFMVEGRPYVRGSLLIRKSENADDVAANIREAASLVSVDVVGVNTALSDDGPDLGGREFQLLEKPRIALLNGPDVNILSFGAIWHMLDADLKYKCSLIDQNRLKRTDLRKYNVLILPSGGVSSYRAMLGDMMPKLKSWVADGGTIIAVEGAAAFLADSTTAVSNVRLRRQALGELDVFSRALDREAQANSTEIDSVLIWDNVSVKKRGQSSKMKEENGPTLEVMKEMDARDRLLYPRGTALRASLDPEHWLSFGGGDHVPALVNTSYAYLAKKPVETVARLASADSLRISGLIWPEARERWQKTAFLTREGLGRGQLILFAGEPVFRSYWYGTARLLANAIVLGPGFGTTPVVAW